MSGAVAGCSGSGSGVGSGSAICFGRCFCLDCAINGIVPAQIVDVLVKVIKAHPATYCPRGFFGIP